MLREAGDAARETADAAETIREAFRAVRLERDAAKAAPQTAANVFTELEKPYVLNTTTAEMDAQDLIARLLNGACHEAGFDFTKSVEAPVYYTNEEQSTSCGSRSTSRSASTRSSFNQEQLNQRKFFNQAGWPPENTFNDELRRPLGRQEFPDQGPLDQQKFFNQAGLPPENASTFNFDELS